MKLKGPELGEAYLGGEDDVVDLPPAPPAGTTLRGINGYDNNPVISTPLATINDYVKIYEDDFKRYLCGLIDPEYAYQKGLQIKIPSPLPIPSTTFTQVSSFTIATENNRFWLCWNPCFSSTRNGIKKFKFYRDSEPRQADPRQDKEVYANISSSCFYGRSKEELLLHYDQLPDVEVSRMRLVSAKMKVTYRGSSDNLAGKMVSCASFQPMPNVVAHDLDGKGFVYFYSDSIGWYRPLPNTLLSFAATGYSKGTELQDGNLVSLDEDRTDTITSQAVINGLWAKSMTLSEINRGLTCTYLPVDQDATVFTTPGTIRGSVLTKKIDKEIVVGGQNRYSEQLNIGEQAGQFYIDNAAAPIIDLHGGRMGFFVVGEGLPNDNTAIDVEFYYNWEILPTVSSASSMRNFAQSYIPPDTIYKDIMANININEASISLIKNADISNLRGPERLGSIFSWLAPVGKLIAKGAGALLSNIGNS